MNIIKPSYGNIKICKNKSFEYQFEGPKFMGSNILECKLEYTRNCDHAGVSFTFGIYKLFWFCLKIYDHRHWNDDTNDWLI